MPDAIPGRLEKLGRPKKDPRNNSTHGGAGEEIVRRQHIAAFPHKQEISFLTSFMCL